MKLIVVVLLILSNFSTAHGDPRAGKFFCYFALGELSPTSGWLTLFSEGLSRESYSPYIDMFGGKAQLNENYLAKKTEVVKIVSDDIRKQRPTLNFPEPRPSDGLLDYVFRISEIISRVDYSGLEEYPGIGLSFVLEGALYRYGEKYHTFFPLVLAELRVKQERQFTIAANSAGVRTLRQYSQAIKELAWSLRLAKKKKNPTAAVAVEAQLRDAQRYFNEQKTKLQFDGVPEDILGSFTGVPPTFDDPPGHSLLLTPIK